MKYVGVTHNFNSLDYTDITRFSIGNIYWFKFYEDDLGPLDDVKIGQPVLVDTGRGFYVGRIVKKSNVGMNEEDVTREVISLLYARDTLVEKLEAEK